MISFQQNWWIEIFLLFLFVDYSGVYSLEISTNLIISNWTLPGDKLAVSCYVTSLMNSESKMYNVHLLCPLLDGNSCLVNCHSQCSGETGACTNTTLQRIIHSCNIVRSQTNKIDLHYQINTKSIPMSGSWLCQYGGIKSEAIFIPKSSKPTMSTSVTTTLSTTELLKKRPLSSSSAELNLMPVLKNEMKITELKIIIILLISLIVSFILNVVLITIICVTRKKFQRNRKTLSRKENVKDITETTSMLTKSSTHHQLLNRSNCSRTPSLDSPSFRESIVTYLPDNSTFLPATTVTAEPHSYPYYQDQFGRLIQFIQPINNYTNDGTDILSHHSSGESTSLFRPMTHNGNILIPHRISSPVSYIANWGQLTPQHQESFSSSRGCSSQQQIYLDSNDESGLGSQSLSHSIKPKHGLFHGGRDKVDLIVDCDPNSNNLIRPQMNVQ